MRLIKISLTKTILVPISNLLGKWQQHIALHENTVLTFDLDNDIEQEHNVVDIKGNPVTVELSYKMIPTSAYKILEQEEWAKESHDYSWKLRYNENLGTFLYWLNSGNVYRRGLDRKTLISLGLMNRCLFRAIDEYEDGDSRYETIVTNLHNFIVNSDIWTIPLLKTAMKLKMLSVTYSELASDRWLVTIILSDHRRIRLVTYNQPGKQFDLLYSYSILNLKNVNHYAAVYGIKTY